MLLSYETNGGRAPRPREGPRGRREGRRDGGHAAVLYATMPREKLIRGSRIAQFLHFRYCYPPEIVPTACSPHATITYRVDVRAFAGRKKRAMAQHRSQMPRLVPLLLGVLPSPVFGLFAGREWFVERGAGVNGGVRNAIFDGVDR